MEQTYIKHRKLIYKKAHEYHRRHNFDLQELISEGNLIFTKTFHRYNQQLASFSTFLYIKLEGGMKDKIRKEKKHLTFLQLNDQFAFYNKEPLIINALSNQSKKVVKVIQEIRFNNRRLNGRINKGEITEALRKQGFKYKQIYSSYAEIKNKLLRG